VLLITGVPGVGKTTVMRRVKGLLAGKRTRGFLTDEIRNERGERLGFQIETLDGRIAPLAGVGLRSPNRIGRYGVDLDALNAVAVPALALEERAICLIDEIGKMECLSGAFSEAVLPLHGSQLVADANLPVLEHVGAQPAAVRERIEQRLGDDTFEIPARLAQALPLAQAADAEATSNQRVQRGLRSLADDLDVPDHGVPSAVIRDEGIVGHACQVTTNLPARLEDVVTVELPVTSGFRRHRPPGARLPGACEASVSLE